MRLPFDVPVLPLFLQEVMLRHLHLESEAATVRLRRYGPETVGDVLGRGGPLRVVAVS